MNDILSCTEKGIETHLRGAKHGLFLNCPLVEAFQHIWKYGNA